MAPKKVAPEDCENHNVAGSSLELERVVDDKDTKRQSCELEYENGGKREKIEEAVTTMDGNGPVLETAAQDRSPLDREVQSECFDRLQRTSAQLGRSCFQNGVLRDVCEGLEVSGTSVVVATTPLERSGEGQSRWRSPSMLEMQMALRKQSTKTHCDKPCLGVANVDAGEMHQQRHEPTNARLVGGMLSVDGWRRIVVVASSGDE